MVSKLSIFWRQLNSELNRTQQSEIRSQKKHCNATTELIFQPMDNASTDNNKTFYNVENDCNSEDWSASKREIYIYTAIILTSIILVTFRSILFLKIAMKSAENLHNSMFKSLIRAPMRFFDVNPSGRILNRFSRDTGAVDDLLPRIMLESIQVLVYISKFLTLLTPFQVLLVMTGILVMVLVANYYMIVAIVFLIVALSKLRSIYIATAKNVKHLEGIGTLIVYDKKNNAKSVVAAKSPVFSHFNASLHGLVTIRASKAEKKLKWQFDRHQDAHTSAWFLTIACTSAFGLWLDFLCIAFVATITFTFISLNKGK